MLTRYGRFTFIISEISKSLQKVSSDEMSRFDLHGSYAKYILALLRYGPQTAAQLAQRCDRNKADVSRAIATLTERGVVERLGKGKNYKVGIALTEKGEQIGASLHERLKLVISGVSGELSDEELDGFYRALDVIATNLARISSEGLSDR